MTRPKGAEGMPGIIVPRKTVLELVRLIEGEDGEIEVALSANKIRFSWGALVLTSKLIDGTFPDYERVIPRHNDKVLEVDTAIFASAVDRVSTISSEKGRAVKLNISSGKLVLSVNNPDSGSAEEEIAATYDAEPLDIGFNSKYLLDIAVQIKNDQATFPARRCRLADHHSRSRRRSGALCPDADAGVIQFTSSSRRKPGIAASPRDTSLKHFRMIDGSQLSPG